MSVLTILVVSYISLELLTCVTVFLLRKKIANFVFDRVAQATYYALRVREEEINEEYSGCNGCGNCDCSSDEIH